MHAASFEQSPSEFPPLVELLAMRARDEGTAAPFPGPFSLARALPLSRTHALPLIEGHCQDAAVCTPPDRLRAYPRICSSAPFRPIVCPLSYTMCLAPATPPTASPSPAASTFITPSNEI